MKNGVLMVVSFLLAAVLLIPIPMRLKDGGSVEYRAILYKVVDMHRIDAQSPDGYIDGTVVEILGMEVYRDVP
ncbi:MAG: hypothetical protein E7604_09770 [Ruminococcaceae bacterium]|nr:hypothetical protein [Oscillospiraceae bacterium]